MIFFKSLFLLNFLIKFLYYDFISTLNLYEINFFLFRNYSFNESLFKNPLFIFHLKNIVLVIIKKNDHNC
jgi:hypothetical protein